MPKYAVTVRYEMERVLTVYARDEAAAEDKACEIVEGWNDVRSAEAVDVEADD